MSSSPSKELFQRMRDAINEAEYDEMESILEERDYSPDAVGAGGFTNLHTAVNSDDDRAINMLLGQRRQVDSNIKNARGQTPLMLASSKGKIRALGALLADLRVNLKIRDDEDQTAEQMFNCPDGSIIKRAEGRKLFEERERQGAAAVKGARLAVLIGNSHYQGKGSGLSDLPGAGRDVKEIAALLKTSNYDVKIVMNSENIIQSIMEVMKEIPSGSIQYFQFFYAGNDV